MTKIRDRRVPARVEVLARILSGIHDAGLHRAFYPGATMRAREAYVLISPTRDEATHARYTLESVVQQTVRPRLWVIVDDGSTDDTPDILDHYAQQYDFIRVIRRDDRGERRVGPGVVDAFYTGLAEIDLSRFSYLGKLDLDLELPADYFETLMQRMEADPRLGTCSGKPYYRKNGRLISEGCSDEMSVGMTKFYRVRCFEAIGGFARQVMWDGLDCHTCRMHGWKARSWGDTPALRFIHRRPMGSSDKHVLRGRARHGYGQYLMGTSPWYMAASVVYRVTARPRILGALAMGWGYSRAALSKARPLPSPETQAFIRRFQMRCLVAGKTRATREFEGATHAADTTTNQPSPASTGPSALPRGAAERQH